MNNFQRITASREALAAFLGTIPAIETPWDDAFHRLYCSSCAAADCDDCRRPERDMSELVTMYPAQANSPETSLSGALTAAGTTVSIYGGLYDGRADI